MSSKEEHLSSIAQLDLAIEQLEKEKEKIELDLKEKIIERNNLKKKMVETEIIRAFKEKCEQILKKNEESIHILKEACEQMVDITEKSRLLKEECERALNSR